ncbi:23S rRNA (guanosine(2251)-2'-O)-methyltransferase RlmB [Pelagibius litoralis]|uniref:23S rRNA (Guanosine(2251)-2'-O)-methyltransferase RlmB n=1 Tax=Pelagibius litoralis TaxID=374515 RepID=A0A967CCD2_9PROT|nr:23S rRNA (guanosine(2251)-2'-O)-methyltransferase RlmB [Pelagibius litoralis]NIA68998.1 23S rRNA (guanosine(2251)-2'-O)-methyltransferase RlmB [Pelagibius litoralis]
MTKRKTKHSGSQQGKQPVRTGRNDRNPRHSAPSAGLWLYGVHPVLAALANPRRRIRRLLLSPEAAQTWGQRLRQERDPHHDKINPETLSRREIDDLLPEGAVHQGLALLSQPLDQPAIEDIIADKTHHELAESPPGRRVILLLDQVTDPHNVGAVLRSAAAFGAQAVVALDAGAPEESGSLAKSASGALEVMPYVTVTNLARTLDSLKEAGYWCLGLAGEADHSLAQSNPAEAVALVLGAEGSGLRRLTRERCDLLVKLPTRPPIQALNISNAAAVALYELLGRG